MSEVSLFWRQTALYKHNFIFISTGSSRKGLQRCCLLLDCSLMCLLVKLSTIYSWVVPSRLRLIDDATQLLDAAGYSRAHGKYSFPQLTGPCGLRFCGECSVIFPSTLSQLYNT